MLAIGLDLSHFPYRPPTRPDRRIQVDGKLEQLRAAAQGGVDGCEELESRLSQQVLYELVIEARCEGGESHSVIVPVK